MSNLLIIVTFLYSQDGRDKTFLLEQLNQLDGNQLVFKTELNLGTGLFLSLFGTIREDVYSPTGGIFIGIRHGIRNIDCDSMKYDLIANSKFEKLY